ncbi:MULTISPECIES: hypothetical protein [unclassified Haloferax]|uniref:hypothetical protein n=1 Tax=unclassified Haloferax TaxID=2625095 RepID=UPI0002B0954C|nr:MULTISPECIES: hypothetical protein [unclassified Haloferax]ELZ61033.1 hypothetical protein C460_02487 [Haloferax sp. ATCC BAA-646]ELZ67606.1 hypothetical protein C459_01278 [Haloferax sp. ATCC BAA-645]ELZ68179.1 hypothetical protein C458_09171 [Haloferax sp. ATCC BAA-644]
MRLPSRRVVLAGLLTGLVLAAGCTSPLSDDESQILIENERESSYSVTVFQRAHETPENLRFDVTTGDGRQKLVRGAELRTEANYTNVTLHDPVRSDRVPTVPNGNSTVFVDDWNESQTTVYVVETHQNELLVVHVMQCGLDMALTFTATPDGEFRTTSRCVQDVHG